ncbi:hypothetical protein SRIMM317S_02920 [Streptomyces rimosus subsp. rimosus]
MTAAAPPADTPRHPPRVPRPSPCRVSRTSGWSAGRAGRTSGGRWSRRARRWSGRIRGARRTTRWSRFCGVAPEPPARSWCRRTSSPIRAIRRAISWTAFPARTCGTGPYGCAGTGTPHTRCVWTRATVPAPTTRRTGRGCVRSGAWTRSIRIPSRAVGADPRPPASRCPTRRAARSGASGRASPAAASPCIQCTAPGWATRAGCGDTRRRAVPNRAPNCPSSSSWTERCGSRGSGWPPCWTTSSRTAGLRRWSRCCRSPWARTPAGPR